jgi:hypothetical protein
MSEIFHISPASVSNHPVPSYNPYILRCAAALAGPGLSHKNYDHLARSLHIISVISDVCKYCDVLSLETCKIGTWTSEGLLGFFISNCWVVRALVIFFASDL